MRKRRYNHGIDLFALPFEAGISSGFSTFSLFKMVMNQCKGALGELETKFRLDLSGEKNHFENLYITRKNGYSTEIDLVLVTVKGIIVIESKNYTGWVFGNETQKYWTHTYPNGRKYRFYNPVMQNKGHISAIAELLELKDECFFQSCILFSPDCALKSVTVTEKNTSLLYYNQLGDYISTLNKTLPDILSPQVIEYISNQLKNCTKVTAERKAAHCEQVSQMMREQGLAEGTVKERVPPIERKTIQSHKQIDLYLYEKFDEESNFGHWSVVLAYGEHRKEFQGKLDGFSEYGSCYRPFLEGLKAVKEPCFILVYCENRRAMDVIRRALLQECLGRSDKNEELKKDMLVAEILQLGREHKFFFHSLRKENENYLLCKKSIEN